MNRFKNILFVADESGTTSVAFKNAVSLANANNASLTVMDVVEPVIWSAENQARFGTDLTTILRDRRLDEIASMTEPYSNENLLIRTQVAIGTVFLEVIRATLRNKFDLVIKNAEKDQGMFTSILGPNDQHLVRKCPCPVWIDREETKHPYKKILVAVDPLGDQDKDMAKLIMDLALSVDPTGKSEVHIAHAWRLPGETSLSSGRAKISRLELDNIMDRQQQMHADALSKLLSNYHIDLSDEKVHFEKDRATSLITRLCKSLSIDLLVSGTVGRTGIPGFFIGNTAESLMHVLDIPVLTVKPRDFVSPVTLS